MTVRVITGDCRDVLRTLPDASVHCCVTSPPYFGLRDYGVVGQIGLEQTPDEYVAELVAVFRDVRRVLRSDGTLWMVIGDSYASSTKGSGGSGKSTLGPNRDLQNIDFQKMPTRQFVMHLAAKQLLGIPWRIAFALQADGWWLRQDIIWSKPNPMPESVTDRCTKAHEYLFLLSKSATYYYDANAIREPYAEISIGRYQYEKQGTAPTALQPGGDVSRRTREQGLQAPNEAGRNKRSVWEVATQSFPSAHFATFPPALIEPCIKAGTSEKGCCAQCGAPWVRQTEDRIVRVREGLDRSGDAAIVDAKGRHGSNSIFTTGSKTVPDTIGWAPSCACNAATVPCTVLDPFFGAGTTGLVADRLQRNCIGIDLNKSYAVMASNRITDDAPLLSEVR